MPLVIQVDAWSGPYRKRRPDQVQFPFSPATLNPKPYTPKRGCLAPWSMARRVAKKKAGRLAQVQGMAVESVRPDTITANSIISCGETHAVVKGLGWLVQMSCREAAVFRLPHKTWEWPV